MEQEEIITCKECNCECEDCNCSEEPCENCGCHTE